MIWSPEYSLPSECAREFQNKAHKESEVEPYRGLGMQSAARGCDADASWRGGLVVAGVGAAVPECSIWACLMLSANTTSRRPRLSMVNVLFSRRSPAKGPSCRGWRGRRTAACRRSMCMQDVMSVLTCVTCAVNSRGGVARSFPMMPLRRDALSPGSTAPTPAATEPPLPSVLPSQASIRRAPHQNRSGKPKGMLVLPKIRQRRSASKGNSLAWKRGHRPG